MAINDKYEEVLQQYGLNVKNIRKGRGAMICDTDQGCKSLREYRGTLKRLEFEDQVLSSLKEGDKLIADQYIKTTENHLIAMGSDGTKYILKDWFADRECNLRDAQEVCRAVGTIALLHQKLRQVSFKEEWAMGSTLPKPACEDMVKHNRELKRARNFIREKRQKSEFELCVMQSFQLFYEQALEAAEQIAHLWNEQQEPYYLCHGDLDHHHVLMGSGYTAIIEYNRLHLGLQMQDLYRFVRKAMEKHDWNLHFGKEMLAAYEKNLPLEKKERECLYYLFLYPEKYWKQINYYFNANKAWIPARNMEKIISLQKQEQERKRFLAYLKEG